MEFSSSAAVPSNGCNKELAHHILYLYNGDIKVKYFHYVPIKKYYYEFPAWILARLHEIQYESKYNKTNSTNLEVT